MTKSSFLSDAAIASVAYATSALGFDGQELLLSAPIQHIGAGNITVLGKDFDTPTENLAVGEIVNIYGRLGPDGSISETAVEGTHTFGGSGDPIFLKGIVSD